MSVTTQSFEPPAHTGANDGLHRAGIAIRGLAALVLGVFGLYRPATATTLVVVFAIFAFVDGIVRIIVALRSTGRDRAWFIHAFEGLVGIAFGVVIFRVARTIISVTWTVAEWAFAIGALTIVFAAVAWGRLHDAWLWLFGGILAVVFAIALLWVTLGGLLAPGYALGIFALIYGVISILIAVRKPRV
jgi:uncharacterized membrane protein HdeD (DUF308 family)